MRTDLVKALVHLKSGKLSRAGKVLESVSQIKFSMSSRIFGEDFKIQPVGSLVAVNDSCRMVGILRFSNSP